MTIACPVSQSASIIISLVAADGQEAVAIAEQHPQDIDLLISDVSMPRINGMELAETLAGKRPHLRVILMSGFSRVQLVLRHGWHFLQKPFLPSKLKETIEKILRQ